VSSPKLRVIPQASFTATPWKNGGGITHEAIRVPASGGPFRWRVSVAHIDASGPFSDFAAYNRTMVLLRGAGLELRVADGHNRTLRRVGELAQFDGALSTYCLLLNGPCVDLNLMVSKADPVVAGVRQLKEPLTLSASPDDTTLVFGLDESIVLDSDTGESATLEPWDLAVLFGCGARLSRLEPADAAEPPESAGAVESAGPVESAEPVDSAATSVFVATLRSVDGAAPGGLC